jgi:NADPH:quinone reductase-like Zn-dependent oxidoreductase
MLLSPFAPQRLRAVFSVERKEDLQFLKELVETGNLKPVVDQTYPLREVATAIRDLQAGRARGKLVVTT